MSPAFLSATRLLLLLVAVVGSVVTLVGLRRWDLRTASPCDHMDCCFSTSQCCWYPMMLPGRAILIQAIVSAAVNR